MQERKRKQTRTNVCVKPRRQRNKRSSYAVVPMELQESIRAGDVDEMQKFMQENEKWNVNSCLGKDGFSLLHWACHFGTLEASARKAHTPELLAAYPDGPGHA